MQNHLLSLPSEVYRNRRLVWKLAKNDFRTRYAGSYLGIIWAFDDDFRVLRNLWQMNESMTRAYDNLWKKAEKKGANAVLGINLCLAPERSIPILQGTAVILEKEDD